MHTRRVLDVQRGRKNLGVMVAVRTGINWPAGPGIRARMGQTPRIFLTCTGFSERFWLRNTQVSLGVMIVESLLQEGSFNPLLPVQS